MTKSDLEQIEEELGVKLPISYRKAVSPYPFCQFHGTMEWSLGDCAKEIIKWTNIYRKGFGVNRSWPENFIVIGLEEDGCPLVLDVEKFCVFKTNRGSLENEYLEFYPTVDSFLAVLKEDLG